MTITQDMIDTWRTNYGLDTKSHEDAMRYWHDMCAGMAPAGAVAALGLALNELDAMRMALAEADTLMDHCDEPTAWRERWAWLLAGKEGAPF